MSKMVQVFMVLRCFSCETFQVHQVKKSSNKWLCKICNEKQSVQKVYGQGTAGDCRQHVQKLNMQRGEKEAAEQQLLNHPPEDYAAAFDEDHHHSNECTTTDHPVLLKEKGSKWKVFTEPQDSNSEEEEEGRGISVFNVPCTTERTEFDQSRRKKRREMKRFVHDPKPHPLSKAVCEDTTIRHHHHTPPTRPHSHKPIHPYSSVSDEMGWHLLSSVESSQTQSLYSSTTSGDRYHKLEESSNDIHDALPSRHSAHDLHSSQKHGNETENQHGNGTSPSLKLRHSHTTQEDRMASIREDIGRYTKSMDPIIPTVSSRWSKFMIDTEEKDEELDGEEEEDRVGPEGGEEGDGVHMHMLQSKLAVARYT